MNPETILDRLEAGERLSSVLPARGVVPDLGEAFFRRIMAYHGSDQTRLITLGRHWRGLIRRVSDSEWVYRGGGGYERVIGKFAASADAFIQAGRVASDPVYQSSFPIGAIDSLARSGRVEEAQALARNVSTRLKNLGEPGLAARAMLNLGNALVYQDRMREARKVLHRALPDLAEADLALEAESARLALSSTYLFDGDPRQAESHAAEVIGAARELEAEYLGQLAQINLGLCLLVTGRPEEAHALLSEIRPDFQDSPHDDARVGEYLSDALFRLNLWSEAEESYREVLATGVLTPLQRANVELGLGQSLIAQGNPRAARPHLRRSLLGYVQLNNLVWQAVCLLNLARADSDQGFVKRALVRLADAENRAVESPYFRVQILLAQSSLGRDRLNEALGLIRKYGYLELEWQVHAIGAVGAGNPERHYVRMFAAIIAGRLGTRSVAARMGFLKDKTVVIQSYLGWLLAKPTRRRVEAATEVIRQIRSVTLLDEILQSGSLPSAVAEALAAVRGELENGLIDGPTGGSRRAVITAGSSIVRAQRTATRALLALNLATDSNSSTGETAVVVAETNRGIQVLHRGAAHLPNVPESKISELLRWLSYDLVAPMADPNVSAEPALAQLSELAEAFSPVWRMPAEWICPDGTTWRVPWSLCASLSEFPKIWSLAMHPGMTAELTGGLGKTSRVAIWLGESVDLPFSRVETESIAARFENPVIARTQAEALRSLDGGFDAIHVVSHAIHRPQNPMLSAILFPDGPIYAYEISRSPLRVNLATLSACETGSVSLATRSEPDGLARAFIGRGAKSVVASQWPLDDEAGYRQFDAIYGALLEKKSMKNAISHAQCISRQWKAHPYYWGALALYSGYQK